MLTKYFEAAMSHAVYEFLDEDGIFYGEIPGLPGLLAIGEDRAACRAELRDALEEWVLYHLRYSEPVPEVDGIGLAPALTALTALTA